MSRRLVIAMIALAVVAFVGVSFAGAADEVLNAGTYTAKVKKLSCGGCGPLVEKTLKSMKQIESATVDSKASSVQFTVKKGESVKLDDVQKELKGASDKMGMGADYTLSDVKKKS